ncbi:TKL protein kinase [Saprolegnia diclina VS20]|uniref:TKL protein kinase n=1 Tax=Saprolegnia diclina (strain VS20) TaxID=1156394 RepID=T0Q125_SAPDV|nr:TKL protein kinase [Saprolegnia diclina VS20]EQC28271.1 TKL protein kinase [Saprolegnia diclina VS20]|eukprot:XP_008618275.1 TKL protein kinase [Saprolegnia diclina VS20]
MGAWTCLAIADAAHAGSMGLYRVNSNGNVECQRHSLDADENHCYWIANVASYCAWYNANPTGYTIECTDYSSPSSYCYKHQDPHQDPHQGRHKDQRQDQRQDQRPDQRQVQGPSLRLDLHRDLRLRRTRHLNPAPTMTPNAGGATTKPTPGSDHSLAPPKDSQTGAPLVPLLLATNEWSCLKNADSKLFTPARIDPDLGQLECLSVTTAPRDVCAYSADAATCAQWLLSVHSCWLSDSKTALRSDATCPRIILVPSSPTSAIHGPSDSSSSPNVSWFVVAAASVAVVALVLVVVWYRRRQANWAKAEESPNASYMFCWTDKAPPKAMMDLPKTNSLGSDDDVVGGQLNMGDLVLWRLDEAKLETSRVLSVGAYGVVSLGTYQGSPVAIKQLAGEKSTATVQAFIDEIRLMTTLESKYIVRLLGCAWVRPRDIQLIVEFMDHGDLRQLLAVSPSISWRVKVQLARDMVQGLVYLHSMDIIHRDIKSRNVLLHTEAHMLRAKLTDFGISRIVDVDMTARVGTFRWTAPEVLEGSAYSLAADVYSLGMVLWELETHAIPFGNVQNGWNEYQWIEALKAGSVRPECSPTCPLADVIHQCTQYTPSARPTALALGTMLDNIALRSSAD